MEIKKYRKKPVEVEAVQYNGYNFDDIKKFVGKDCIVSYKGIDFVNGMLINCYDISIHTKEGLMHVSPKDYIIKGVNGEFYPCKPDIFIKTYDNID